MRKCVRELGSDGGRALCAGLAGILCLVLAGCTSRAMTVTSIPEGAEVSINRRVVGKTPVRVNYTHYGTYRIELRKERYQTLVREETLRPPWYGYDPAAFFADNAIPARANDESYLHYVMEEVPEQADRDSLMERAALARDGKVTHPRTQEHLEIAWAPPQPRPATATELGPTTAATGPAVQAPAATPTLELPPELKAPAGITEKPPEAPKAETPATEPGKVPAAPTPEPGKGPAVTAPTPPAPPPPLPPKRMKRTPKGEILIYDEPAVEDPEKK